jgi:hypothetical protein
VRRTRGVRWVLAGPQRSTGGTCRRAPGGRPLRYTKPSPRLAIHHRFEYAIATSGVTFHPSDTSADTCARQSSDGRGRRCLPGPRPVPRPPSSALGWDYDVDRQTNPLSCAVTAARDVFCGHGGGPTCSRVWRSRGARRGGHPRRRPLVQPRDHLNERRPLRTMPPWLVRGAREPATIRGH